MEDGIVVGEMVEEDGEEVVEVEEGEEEAEVEEEVVEEEAEEMVVMVAKS